MPTAKATKASDKALICRKLVTALQKMYGKSVPRIELPVLETFLFAICLEDNGWDAAEAGYKRLISSYFDLNEIRVSSVTELERILAPLKQADWKGLRIRSVLRYVFESTYSFDFEKFRRQTQEVAVKTLKKVNDLSPFVRDFALQQLLGSHIICLDQSMLAASHWLGLVPEEDDADAAGEFLKNGLKKSEVAEFCHLLRCLATDDKYIDRFRESVDAPLEMSDVVERLAELQNPPKKKAAKTPEKASEAAAAVSKNSKAAKPAVSKAVPAEAPAKTVEKTDRKSEKSAVRKSASSPAPAPAPPSNSQKTASAKPSAPGKKDRPAAKSDAGSKKSAANGKPADRKHDVPKAGQKKK